MAIYEYYCKNCRDIFQLQRPMSEYDQPGVCPRCGAKGERLVSSFASKIDYNLQVPSKAPFRQFD